MRNFAGRWVVALAFAFFACSGVAQAAGENSEGHEAQRNAGPAPNPGRAREMHQIEDQFYVFWKLTLSPAPDYKAIRQALDRMGESVGTIRKSYADAALEQPLKDLSAKVDRLKKAASGKDQTALRKGYDELYGSCFQCHFTHEQPKP